MRTGDAEASRRVYRLRDIVVEEAGRDLLIGGQSYPIEAKPRLLLLALLNRPGEVLTRYELMAAAWGNGDLTNEQSLATAISKVRIALGDSDRTIIQLVPREGYRVALPVETWTASESSRLNLRLTAGAVVPLRSQWRLENQLDASGLVWRATHVEAGNEWVFTFADNAGRSAVLRREVDSSQRLQLLLGACDDLIRVVDSNLEQAPHFVARPFAGNSLAGHAIAGGLDGLDLDARIGLVAQAARAVARAHGAGVTHGAIGPEAIVLAPGPDSLLQARVFGFRGAEPETAPADDAVSQAGNLPAPPAQAAGRGDAIAVDLHALGILLFKMSVGDLRAPLGPDWDLQVPDALLRQDIAAAAAESSGRQLASVAQLAERLETLPERRAAQAREQAERLRQEQVGRAGERSRARRPYVVATFASLTLGAVFSAAFAVHAGRERQAAQLQSQLVQSIDTFLLEDVLSRADPVRAGKADETIADAILKAQANVETRFAGEPLIAGSIQLTLARTFERRTMYDAARSAYDNAARDFEEAEGPASPKAAAARLQHAVEELSAQGPDSAEQAKRLMAAATARFPTVGARSEEMTVWLAEVQGMLAVLEGDNTTGLKLMTRAADQADAAPLAFDRDERFRLRERQAGAYQRLLRWDKAEDVFRRLLSSNEAALGAANPDVLAVKLYLALIDVARHKPARALAGPEAIEKDVVAVYGPDNKLALRLMATKGVCYDQMGRYDDAVRVDLDARARVVALHGGLTRDAISLLNNAGNASCRAGHLEDGLSMATRAHDDAVHAFGTSNPQSNTTATTVAFCLIMAHRDTEAMPLLRNADVGARDTLSGNPFFKSEVDLMRAQVAADTGDVALARELLRDPRKVFKPADADIYLIAWAERLERRLDACGSNNFACAASMSVK